MANRRRSRQNCWHFKRRTLTADCMMPGRRYWLSWFSDNGTLNRLQICFEQFELSGGELFIVHSGGSLVELRGVDHIQEIDNIDS